MAKALNQGKYYIFTIPYGTEFYTDQLKDGVVWMKGQREIGESGYDHWQVMMCFAKKMRPGGVRKLFPNIHNELVMSLEACEEYVWKDETAVPGTRFEIGQKPLKRNCAKDWDTIREMAQNGQLDDIDSSVYICHYRSLKQIAVDHMKPLAEERRIKVFWGATGTGKSRKAWEEASWDAYPKDPNTKFWDGYSGQENVVIDEFRGRIDIAHILRWFDRYPVVVEVKGSSQVFKARNIWITSNLDPRAWYPELDTETKMALLRRLDITHFAALPPSVPANTPCVRRPIRVYGPGELPPNAPVHNSIVRAPPRGHKRDLEFHLVDETPCPVLPTLPMNNDDSDDQYTKMEDVLQKMVDDAEVQDAMYEMGREMLEEGTVMNPIVIDEDLRSDF